jgi:DNA polymerase III delta prime subunit
MALTFAKAVKHERKLRLAFIGPAGSGKTLTALKVASGLGGKIGLIDTEQGSASIYADQFDFDQLILDSYAPSTYVDALKAAQGYDVVIIDSLSHAWAGKGGALDQVDRARSKSNSGNSYIAWGNVTPQQNAMVESILTAPFHVITTMRSKMEYVQERDSKGKTQIRKVGLQPVQRDGLEYEFDIVGDVDQTHTLTISKTRYSDLADRVINEPTEQLGVQISEWLHGVEAPAPEEDEEPSIVEAPVQPEAEPEPAAPAEPKETWDFYESFLRPAQQEKARVGEFAYYDTIVKAYNGAELSSNEFPPKANGIPKKDIQLQKDIIQSLGLRPAVESAEGLEDNLDLAAIWFQQHGSPDSLFASAIKGLEEIKGNVKKVAALWEAFASVHVKKAA